MQAILFGTETTTAALVTLTVAAFLLVAITIVVSLSQSGTERTTRVRPTPVIQKAAVVAKRLEVQGGRRRSRTFYHATFEFANGVRIEFEVSGAEYGLLVEGDHGEVHFQSSHYLGFVRSHAEAGASEPVFAEESLENPACAHCGATHLPGASLCAQCGSMNPA